MVDVPPPEPARAEKLSLCVSPAELSTLKARAKAAGYRHTATWARAGLLAMASSRGRKPAPPEADAPRSTRCNIPLTVDELGTIERAAGGRENVQDWARWGLLVAI